MTIHSDRPTPITDAVFAEFNRRGEWSIVRPGDPPSDPWTLARRFERDRSVLREALKSFMEAFRNRGQWTSLHDWNEGMKIADEQARAALAACEEEKAPT